MKIFQWIDKMLCAWLLPEKLRPGLCECDHNRCDHEQGSGRCMAEEPPDEEWPQGSICACQIYIRAKDDNDGDVHPETPSPSELQKLYEKV